MSDSNFVIWNQTELDLVLIGISPIWKIVQYKVDADIEGEWIKTHYLVRHLPSGKYFEHIEQFEREYCVSGSSWTEYVKVKFPLRLDDLEVQLAEYPRSVYDYKFKKKDA